MIRCGVIGLGRQAYYDAMKDPETLANQPRGVDLSHEAMLYVARRAYEAVTGRKKMPASDRIYRKEPLGEPWEEETVAEKYPKLAKRFGFG